MSEVKFEFTGPIQKKIFAMLLFDRERYADYGDIIRPEFFENPALRDFAAILYRFYHKFHRPATVDEAEQEVAALIDGDSRIPTEEYAAVWESAKAEGDNGDFEYAREKAVDFARIQAVRLALLEGSKRVKKGQDLDKILYDIQAALAVGEGAEEVMWRRMSEIEPEEVEWLWEGRFARGKLSLIVGDPESGKSLFSALMAAHVSSSTPWPDAPEHKPRPEPGKVIFLQDEDDPEDTLVRRLNQFGAIRENIIHVDGIRSAEKGDRLFSLLTDLDRLEKLITREGNVKLIILDPLSAYFGVGVNGKLNPHVDAHVRTILSPVKAFAKRLNVAVVGLVHLNKDAQKDMMYRVGGSIALMGVPRSVWLIKWDRDPKGPRYFQSMKSNLRTGIPGLAFYVDPELGGVRFDLDADVPKAAELLAPVADRQPLEEAKAFILDGLNNGPRDSKDIEAEAEQKGINRATLFKAKKELGIESRRLSDYGGRHKKWQWVSPMRGAEAQPEPLATETRPEPSEDGQLAFRFEPFRHEPSPEDVQKELSLQKRLADIKAKRERMNWAKSSPPPDSEAIVEAESQDEPDKPGELTLKSVLRGRD
jgi:putative DNA primase/helicase